MQLRPSRARVFFAQPVEGLRRLEPRPDNHGEYLQQLVKWRRQEIDAVWRRLAEELRLDDAQRKRADAAVIKLAAVGMLVIPDWIEELIRSRRLKWLTTWHDAKLPRQWTATPVPDTGPAQSWHLQEIHKPPLLTGAGVTVGVIDSGYDPAFGDLVGTFTPVFGQYTDPQPPSTSTFGSMVTGGAASDSSGNHHGSKVCVMLAGATAGVAPNASVLMASIQDGKGVPATQGMFVIAIDWLLSHPHVPVVNPDRPIGCDIITTSVTTSLAGSSDPGSEVAAALQSAELFNTLVVAAIGNASTGVGLNAFRAPGTGAHVIGVGAVDPTLTVADFSAYGITPEGLNKPDIVAPGRDLEFPKVGGGHDLDEGTSFATPIVAGAAALILEAIPALRLNVTNFRNKVLGFVTAATEVHAGDSGNGMIDLNGL